jgi:hypothetical protein
LYRFNQTNIKLIVYLVLVAFILNVLYPSFSITRESSNKSSNKIPICTAYGIKYVSIDTDNNTKPDFNGHCKLCFVVKSISDGFTNLANYKIADAYECVQIKNVLYIDEYLNSKYITSNKSRAPPFIVI